MADRKVFAGPRLRRVRTELGLSQTEMAGRLDISPSYLNLIERNQRPLTVQVLMKLSGVFGIDVAELQSDGDGGAIEALREAFSDPILAAELPSQSELIEAADVAPNLARGVARLHAAYREALERLSDLSHTFAEQENRPAEAAERLPFDQVRTYFERRSPWIGDLEEAAETIAGDLAPRDDPFQALKARLRDDHGIDVRVLPLSTMPDERARFDRHSMRLFISERVAPVDRAFLAACRLVLLSESDLLDRLSDDAGMADPEAGRLCRGALAERLALAVLVPAARLRQAAGDLRYDIRKLADRFSVRRSKVMARLAALGAGETDGEPASGSALPAAYAVLDATGAVLTRVAAAGFAFPRFGALCGRLPVFDGLGAGDITAAPVRLGDGSDFVVVAAAEAGLTANDGGAPPRVLSFIAFPEEAARGTVYAAMDGAPRPAGLTCRLCDRRACPHRSHPPVARPAAFQDYSVGLSDHELA